MSDVAQMAAAFSQWLNSTYAEDLDPEAKMWRRTRKVSEESGEVEEAIGAYWGENPRKPKGTVEDIIKELLDTAFAALGAVEDLTDHSCTSLVLLTEHAAGVCARSNVEVRDGMVIQRHCPDGGVCHHECASNGCFRVGSCGPLSGVYEDDRWPDDIKAAYSQKAPIDVEHLLELAKAVANGVISWNSGPAAPIFDEFDAQVERSRGQWAAVDGKAMVALRDYLKETT